MEAQEPSGRPQALREERGREVRRLRLAAGLTPQALAQEAGYHRVSVTQVESGRQDLSRDFVRRLEAVLDADGRLVALYERFDSCRSARQRTSAPRPRASTVAPPEGSHSEHADLHTIFGPTSLAMQALGVAADLGDGKEVLRRARLANVTPLRADLLERRSQFLIDVARGHEQRVQDREAVATVLEAERLSPEEVRHNAGARSLVARLLARERRGAAPGLRELAGRVGLAA